MKKLILAKTEIFKTVVAPEIHLEDREILIKVAFSGICGADMKSFRKGHRDLVLPRVLGHEITGTIHKMGKNAKTNYQIGDRVQIFPGVFCGECEYCLTGRDNLCDTMQILGFHIDGGLQEYLVVNREIQENMLNLIPDGLPMEYATFAEPLACSINIQDKLDLGTEDTLLILGAGRLGMINYFLARKRGLRKVIIADNFSPRLDKTLYDNTIDLTASDPLKTLAEITGKIGVTGVIICTPSPASLELAISLAAKGGKIGYFSGLHEFPISTKLLNYLHYKELVVTGSYGCTLQGNKDALELLRDKLIPFDKISLNFFSLEDTQKAVEMLENREILSAIVKL
ncbi:MAG: alcohol dehydrogenase catalytic domain-containing protein [Eubacteriaceae bacterium]|nr:alcohol dehydrogenase catalytic domain-containing protein [Eubacteriaceae bacterium]